MAVKVVNAFVKASKVEDIAAPFIWAVGLGIKRKEIVRITNLKNRKKVWVEIINGNENFINNYNDRRTISIKESDEALIVSEWYRDLLGLDKNKINRLEIERNNYPLFWKSFLAARSHPDSSVRLATDLANLSVLLGVLSLIIGFFASNDVVNNNYYLSASVGNSSVVEAVEYVASVSGFESGDYHLPEYDWAEIKRAINGEDVIFIIASGFTDPQRVKKGNACDNKCLANKRALEVQNKLNSLLVSPKPIFNMANGLDNGVRLLEAQANKYSTERQVKIYIGMKSV